ncbi:hypothetical protein NBH00_14840 [Paraconexibacter antarcticus]|uniref:Uncharacterized protein n=1 Tax=Paraconexibacter antarcticus TaxID=2949664 RepID=A0ABY5DPX4_9ACTN|nr:hypothetical protein [Paraconexibacter antarcticus]UTI62634.1 hypothetical protein NBH00_14840 [Paraconexibacter antarcticus]
MSTSLTVREARAQIVLEAILRHPGQVHTRNDIRGLSNFDRWGDDIFSAAVDDLVRDGRLTEAASGLRLSQQVPA